MSLQFKNSIQQNAKLFLKAYDPTEEDIKKELTTEQLKELCVRLNCRVNMYYWNPVQDYVERFNSEGRLQNKSRKSGLKLLAKAVNRYKETAIYTTEEIEEARYQMWCYRKKENLMRLDLWEYDKEIAIKKANNAHIDINGTQNISHDVSVNIGIECTQENVVNPSEVDIGEYEEIIVDVEESRKDNIQKICNIEHVEGINSEVLNDYNNINTESMTISTMPSNSEDVVDIQVISEPVLYEEFDIHLPTTSTQKTVEYNDY